MTTSKILAKKHFKLNQLAMFPPYMATTKECILLNPFFKSQFNNGSLTIHHQNLQKLAVEMFKVSTSLSPKTANELFNAESR